VTPNHARSLYPTGTDRLTVLNGELVMVTVVEHTDDAVIVGLHPHLLRIPYTELQWTLNKETT
jgi:hypothetical protein